MAPETGREAGRTGVALLSMGEPESLSGVRPFLRELLSDRALVRFPVPALQPVFAWLVSTFGGGRLRRRLEAIGGGSPLVKLTSAQARALEAALARDGDFKVYPVTRYCPPSAREAARRMKADAVTRVTALPLYPQFCEATTGSSLRDLEAALADSGLDLPVAEVRSWPDHPGYISSLCGLIAASLGRRPLAGVHLLFCGHGIPLSFVESGDPYPREIDRTVSAVQAAFPDLPASLAWQGMTGRGKWLAPDAVSEVRRLGGAGVETLVVVPVSFVSDHSETMWELDMDLKRKAAEAGIRTFLRVPSLNDAPAFIATLRDLTLNHAHARVLPGSEGRS